MTKNRRRIERKNKDGMKVMLPLSFACFLVLRAVTHTH